MELLLALYAQKEALVGAFGVLVLVSSTIAQYTSNEKLNTFVSRLVSLNDLLSGSVGKANPAKPYAEREIWKDAGKLVKHIVTGKFDT